MVKRFIKGTVKEFEKVGTVRRFAIRGKPAGTFKVINKRQVMIKKGDSTAKVPIEFFTKKRFSKRADLILRVL